MKCYKSFSKALVALLQLGGARAWKIQAKQEKIKRLMLFSSVNYLHI
ncbi:hypothetical protein [Rivularia sp. UHCC 0363]|nr:hypothetical protein [Rivularia sp. UHCC 0363]MEA5599472.1 hypothetical protein [Rivularia sp. UHCC 0363]